MRRVKLYDQRRSQRLDLATVSTPVEDISKGDVDFEMGYEMHKRPL